MQTYQQAEPAEWFYQSSGGQCGPLTLSQMRQAAEQHLLRPDSPVYAPHLGAWHPAGLVPGLLPVPPRPGDDAAMRALLPVGRSGWAIAAGYLGLIGAVAFPLAPLALLCAELGRRSIEADSHKHGMGRVVIGYLGGVIGLLVGTFVLIG